MSTKTHRPHAALPLSLTSLPSSILLVFDDVWKHTCKSKSRYLASARCSSSGVLVLVEPVSTVNGGDQHLATPKTERCSNCSGSGKGRHLGFWFPYLFNECHMELFTI
ncbi:uncharacterized protein LOC114261454 isoform X5 [Camellia sinensis]|uniref:uncharacterized protein LOC114261454 isoform X5 n=1 Tax=Camellia sinensis TaxID=4442 RepID=UPI0010367883|nr:uncharacterized protein LOC114261454 isoform X5 [Camellia sinensis]